MTAVAAVEAEVSKRPMPSLDALKAAIEITDKAEQLAGELLDLNSRLGWEVKYWADFNEGGKNYNAGGHPVGLARASDEIAGASRSLSEAVRTMRATTDQFKVVEHTTVTETVELA